MQFKQINKIICLLLISCGIANAQIPVGLKIDDNFQPGFGSSIGSVYMIDGTAIVVHDSQSNKGYRVFKGMRLYQKDTLYTQKPGRLLLNMQDGSQLTIGSQSKLTLNKVGVMPTKKSRKSFIRMQRGKARFNVRKLSNYRNTDFKVKTQTALIGVRGSDFFIVASQTTTSVTTFDQTKLAVIGLAKPQLPPTILQDFQRVHIESGERPSDIEHISPEEIQSLKSEFQFSSKPVGEKKVSNDETTETSESDSETSETDSETSETDSESSEAENSDADASETEAETETETSETASTDDTTEPSVTDDEALESESVQSTDEHVSSVEPSENNQVITDDVPPVHDSSQEAVLLPTQEIIAPSQIEQAQAPSMDQIAGHSAEALIQKQENSTSEQTHEIFEEIHEEAVMLPSFPETPKY